MARKVNKKHVNNELLDAIFRLEKDWKKIQEIRKHSVEYTFDNAYAEKLARARYLFLLREARHRNVDALHR